MSDGASFITQHRPGLRMRETAEWLAVRDRFRLYLITSVGASEETARTYTYAGASFARWCQQKGEPLITASREAVARFIAWQHVNRSPSTAANKMLALRSLFRWAIHEGLRQDDPTEGMKPKRGKPKARRPYSDADLRALLRACINLRDRALVLFLLATGIRRGEAVGMTVDDIDWVDGVIHIRKGKGQRQRDVAVNVAILSELRAYVGDRTGPVWLTVTGVALTGHQMYRTLQDLGQRAGVGGTGAHRFRTTFANRILTMGGDLGAVQTLMGHADPTMTLHYAAYSQEARALAIQRKQRFAGLIAGESADGEETPPQETDAALTAEAQRVRYELAPAQMETLRLLAEGLSTQEIANRLGIARSRAGDRIRTLKRRFGVERPVQVCVKAAQEGLLPVEAEGGTNDGDQHARQSELRAPLVEGKVLPVPTGARGG